MSRCCKLHSCRRFVAVHHRYGLLFCCHFYHGAADKAAAVEALQGQVQEGTQDIAQSISDLDRRLTSVENGWGINYKHDAILGLCSVSR